MCHFYQEKEKEAKRLSLVSSTPWSSMMVALHHMAIAEKTYFSLPFFAKKFFRKDVGFILKAYILEKENDLFVKNLNGFCTYKSVTKSMLSLGNGLITVSHDTSKSVPNPDNNRSYRDIYILSVSTQELKLPTTSCCVEPLVLFHGSQSVRDGLRALS